MGSMTTKEAIQAMLDGKKVKIADWVCGEYMYFKEDFFTDESGTQVCIPIGHNTWEIYEEPKPKQTVVIEKWLCKYTSDGEYRVFETSHINKIDSGWKEVKLLDIYEIKL